MSNLIKEKDKVLSFTLYKVERGKEKICRCNPPHLEIDTTNRIVVCMDCGATIDPFEALGNCRKIICIFSYPNLIVKYTIHRF